MQWIKSIVNVKKKTFQMFIPITQSYKQSGLIFGYVSVKICYYFHYFYFQLLNLNPKVSEFFFKFAKTLRIIYLPFLSTIHIQFTIFFYILIQFRWIPIANFNLAVQHQNSTIAWLDDILFQIELFIEGHK